MYIYRKRACELEILKRVNGSDLIKASYEKKSENRKKLFYKNSIKLYYYTVCHCAEDERHSELHCGARESA